MDYIKQISDNAENEIEPHFILKSSGYTSFEIINGMFIKRMFGSDDVNLLITFPNKEQYHNATKSLILCSALACYSLNNKNSNCVTIGDIVFTNDKLVATVKSITDEEIIVLPLGTFKKISIPKDSCVILNKAIKSKVIEILTKNTLKKRQTGIDNLQSRLSQEFYKHNSILKLYKKRIKIPFQQQKKIVVVSSKNDFLNSNTLPLPHQFVNKNGAFYPDLPFEPTIYVTNDIKTVKDFLIDRDIDIETLIFLGDNKYKSLSSVTRLHRQKKIKRCLFVGTNDIENTDLFKVFKWNWTLPEIAYFTHQSKSKINKIKLLNEDLSKSIISYINYILELEEKYEYLINIKKALRYARKINSVTALDQERIRKRANTIFKEFEVEIKALFEDEYHSIDQNYLDDYEELSHRFQNIVKIIKTNNLKANWFEQFNGDIDFIVVPKIIKNDWTKEIQKTPIAKKIEKKVNSFSELINFPELEDTLVESNSRFHSTQVITLKEYEQREPDDKKYLFISLYGYGVYPETLIEKIISKDVVSEILLYDEEEKVLQYYLQKFYKANIKEYNSKDREILSGIKYIETPYSNEKDIDEWIKHLIENDNQFYKGEEIKYEIIFEGGAKSIKERETKSVYIENFDEHHKDVHELKKGDRIRIYQNPNIDTLHDIIKLNDEKELFTRADKFSRLWKTSLADAMGNQNSDTLNLLYQKMKDNGLTVSKSQFENWLNPENKTKFPKRKIDFMAIVKTVNNDELNKNWKLILQTITEYSGTLNLKGRKFADEIDNYILNGDKGEMLAWLSDKEIEKIIEQGAPLQTIKEIKKLDYGVTD